MNLNLARLLATVVILFAVMKEAGPWTAVGLFLVIVTLEMHNGLFKRLIPPAKECDDETTE